MDTTVSQQSWLILLPQLPAKPDYLRVKLQRRLLKLGAVLVKNGVYALPLNDDTSEASDWLRSELLEDQGDLIVLGSVLCAGLSDGDLIARFRAERGADFESIADAARAALEEASVASRRSDLARLRKALASAIETDFFESPQRKQAQDIMAVLAKSVADPQPKPSRTEPKPHGLVWVTRENVFVDRIASAWLIRRFIDHAATYRFIDVRKPHRPLYGELRFDMPQGEYTHEGDRCTFETLVARFALGDTALSTIGEIVHDIDCQDEKFGRPETAGIRIVLDGIRQSEPSDEQRLVKGGELFDSLYTQFTRG
jgi:hypothetical protein